MQPVEGGDGGAARGVVVQLMEGDGMVGKG